MTDYSDPTMGEIPKHWEFTTLGKACARAGGHIQTGPFGSQLHASDYVPNGVPTVMPVNIGDNRINVDEIARIREIDAVRLSRHRLRPGDIVYSRRGDVERRALVRDEQDGWLCGTGCLKINLGTGVVDPVYASFYLGHPDVRNWITSHAVGTTMPNLNTQILSSVPFALPSLQEQLAIGRVLAALDDKIELNRRMSRTLEAMATALFKTWFVDFDPVVAKAEGRQPYGMNAETAALFPIAFEDSQLGPIPTGWRVAALADVARVVKGCSYTSRELQPSSTALVTLKSFMRGGGYKSDGLKPYVGEYKAEQVLNPGDLVVACTDITQNADVIGRPALIPAKTPYLTLVASLDLLIVRLVATNLSAPFLYHLMQTDEYVGHILGHANGTTVLHLSNMGIPTYKFALPPVPILGVFNKLAVKLHNLIDANVDEISMLTSVRDALLPKLLSGEIRLKTAERQIEQAIAG